jgi:hypothetical protein
MAAPQLQHSSSPAFVRELAQHHHDIDRMLAGARSSSSRSAML